MPDDRRSALVPATLRRLRKVKRKVRRAPIGRSPRWALPPLCGCQAPGLPKKRAVGGAANALSVPGQAGTELPCGPGVGAGRQLEVAQVPTETRGKLAEPWAALVVAFIRI